MSSNGGNSSSSGTTTSFEKKAYALLCHNDDVESRIPVSSVFQDASNDGTAPVDFRLIDCDYILPDSGKTIAERFKLNLKQRPTIFVTGDAIETPKQVPTKHLKTGAMLVKALKSLLEPKTIKIETTQDLRNKCLNYDLCAVLLKAGGKSSTSSNPKYLKDAMAKLIPEYPQVKFVSVDSSVLYLKNLEDLLPELEEDNPLHHRMAIMKKISGTTNAAATDNNNNEDDTQKEDDKNAKKDSGRLITSMTTTDKSLSYGVMSNLIADVVKGSTTMTKLSSLPVIKTRTKKLVQEEKAKRQRRIEQQQRQQSKQPGAGVGDTSSTSFNQFQDNDGSREGRKAERERRRAEHYAQHNVKEKTPEEKAEMERQRRIRMAEEAAKWNIDGVSEEEQQQQQGQDEEYFTTDYDGEDDDSEDIDMDHDDNQPHDDDDNDDDEDVLDLD